MNRSDRDAFQNALQHNPAALFDSIFNSPNPPPEPPIEGTGWTVGDWLYMGGVSFAVYLVGSLFFCLSLMGFVASVKTLDDVWVMFGRNKNNL